MNNFRNIWCVDTDADDLDAAIDFYKSHNQMSTFMYEHYRDSQSSLDKLDMTRYEMIISWLNELKMLRERNT